jgi:hypothetical protein
MLLELAGYLISILVLSLCYAALSAPALDQMYSTCIESDGVPSGLTDATRLNQ